MKKFLLSSLIIFCAMCFTKVGYAQQPGDPDMTFGNNGMVLTNVDSFGEAAYSVTLQPDGKIVAAGYAFVSNDDFAIARYNTDGSLDTSFGGDGIVTTHIGTGKNVARGVAVTPTGKIVAAGMSIPFAFENFTVAQYNTDGSPDTTFGTGGAVITAVSNTFNGSYSVAVQTDGKIVASGYAYFGSNPSFATVRYNTDGSPDTTFGNGGVVITTFFTGNNISYSVVIQADGKIVVGGTSFSDFAIARYNTDGTLDTTFSSDGKVTTSVGTLTDKIAALCLQSDGKIIAAGTAGNGTGNDFGIARYNTDGSLDTSFSGDGMEVINYAPNDFVTSVALQSNGKIVVTGADFSNPYFVLLRFTANGILDSTFGTAGVAVFPLSNSGVAYDVSVQPDGKIVAAGYLNTPNYSNFGITRYITELSIGILEFSSAPYSVLVYPNPVQQSATLEYSLLKEEMISIQLLDIQGKILKTFMAEQKQEAGSHQQNISIPQALPPGSYIIVISSAEGKVSIMIQK